MTVKAGELTTRDKIKESIFAVIYILLVVVLALYLVPRLWWLWVLFIAVGLFLLINWHSRAMSYSCAHCGTVFDIKWYVNLISPQSRSAGWKYLKCPKCGKFSRASIVERDREADDEEV